MYKTVERVKAIPAENIFISRRCSRKVFDENSLYELSHSIERIGLIQPVTVRRIGTRFEVVSGERRYRAALLAGMKKVPCIIVRADEEQAAMMYLADNLHQKEQDIFELSEGIGQTICRYHLTVQEAARRLGKGIMWVEGKLELAKLDRKLITALRKYSLGEEHARAVMNLKDTKLQKKAIEHIAQEGLNGQQAAGYVKWLSDESDREITSAQRRRIYVIKDIRVFLNTVARAVSLMQESGVAAEMVKGEDRDHLILTVRIPKAVEQAQKTS